VPASKCTSLLKNERYTHDLRNVFLFVLPMVVKAVDMLRHSNVLPISVCYFEVAKRFLGLIMVANHEENIIINFYASDATILARVCARVRCETFLCYVT